MSLRRMMLATLGAYVQGLIDAFKARVLAFPGIFEAEACLKTQLDAINDIGLLQDATIVITPNGYNENILHTVKGNTITAAPYNLASYTEAITLWTTSGASLSANSSTTNPFGVSLTNAPKLTETAVNGFHYGTNNPAFLGISGRTYTFSIYLKKGTLATAPDIMQLSLTTPFAVNYANFNIVTGVVTATSACTATIDNTGLSSGWWRCSITATATSNATFISRVFFCNNNPLAAVGLSYLGAITSDVFFSGVQIEESSSPTTYQPILFTQILQQGYAQHTRSTTGYRVESTGLVREVPQANLLTLSDSRFNSWTKPGSPTTVIEPIIDANSPLGFYSHIEDTSAVALQFIRLTVPNIINQTVSFKAIVKKNITVTYNRITLGDANSLNITFNSSTGAFVHNLISANVVSYNSDYWEITGTGVNSGGTVSLVPNVGGLGTGAVAFAAVGVISVVYMQLVYGVTPPTVYYPTVTRTNTPRIDYTDGSCPTLLLEQAATNLLVRSEEFNDGGWLKTNLTVTPNTDTAPNGLLTADTLTATSNDGFIQKNTVSSNLNLIRIPSVYLKRKTGVGDVYLEQGHQNIVCSINSSTWTRCTFVCLPLASTTTIASGFFTVTTVSPHNLVTGDTVRWNNVGTLSGTGTPNGVTTAVTVTSPTQYTFTAGTNTSTNNSQHFVNFLKIRFQTSGDEVYAWGAQLETVATTLQNNYYEPTSYIPTTTATVTRNQDSLNLYKIQENNLLNNTYSVFWEVRKIGGGFSQDYHIALTDTVSGFTRDALLLNGLPLGGRKMDNAVNTTLTIPYTPLSTNYYKGLITCNNGVFEIWIDGSKLTTTTLVNYQNLKLLCLNGNGNGISRYKQVLGWNRVLNRTEIDLLFAYPYYNAGYIPTNNELQQIINRAYAEGFTLPSTTILGHCDTLITEMKADGVWNVSDVYYNFAYNDVALSDFARINWMNPYGGLGLALVTAGVTATIGGFKTTPTTPINLRFNPSLASYNYTLNNAGRMFVIRTDATTGFYYDGDLGGSALNRLYRLGSTASEIKINSSNVFAASSIVVNGTGLKSLMRDSSNSVRFQNKTSLHTSSQVSTALPTNFQSASLLSVGSDAEYSNYWMGASINNTQIQNFRTYYNTYLTSIGLTAFA